MNSKKKEFHAIENEMTADEMKKIMAGSRENLTTTTVNCYSTPYPSGYLGSVQYDGPCPADNILVVCWNAGFSAEYGSCPC